jgi:sugar phosphate isomerase/epimerase
MTPINLIKRGVSLYSFQEEYFHGKMTLEDILATCSKLDIRGIEIIGDQMIRGYPDIPEEFIQQWHGWMDKYQLTPVCLDMFLDWNKYKGRSMTVDERVESIRRDIVNANRLGCSVIRVIHDIEPEILERLAPDAEKYKVTLALEVHAPNDLDSALEQRLIAMFDRVQSPYLGFTVDLGIYCKRLPRVISDRFLRDGMAPAIANFLIDRYNNGALSSPDKKGADNETMVENIFKMGGREQDVYLAFMGTHMCNSNPRRLLDYMHHIKHIHAKFYEMLPDATEYSIPYEEIIPVFQEGGYSGYIDSEYEGNRWIDDVVEVDTTTQVQLQHVQLKQLLGEK